MAQKLPNRKYSVLPGTQDLSLSEYLMDFLYSSRHDNMLEATENLKELIILNICTHPQLVYHTPFSHYDDLKCLEH